MTTRMVGMELTMDREQLFANAYMFVDRVPGGKFPTSSSGS